MPRPRNMRPNIVSEAGVSTRLNQYWESIPFLTSAIVVLCGIIYLVCLLVGYDSFAEVCFLPSAVVSRFQVYRIYTSILFHGSLLHVLFNMMALVPMGSEMERVMGSVRLLYVTILLATSNAIFHILVALLVAHNPIQSSEYFMNECAIGFSGVLFSMIVIETSLSGAQSRSVFGLFNVPAKWYPFLLLVVFQLLMENVSLLGHLCGIISGFAYTYGLFNILIPGTSFYSSIEASSLLSSCVRRPKFIVCTGGNTSGYIPTHTSRNSTSGGILSGNVWRNLSSLMPQREVSAQPTEDSRFPGRGRTLGSGQGQAASALNSDSSLQARLLDNSSPDQPLDSSAHSTAQQLSGGRNSAGNVATVAANVPQHQVPLHSIVTNPIFLCFIWVFDIHYVVHLQGATASEEEIKKLVSMGFDRTQVEVALAAAEGDLNVAVEILMSQQG
ncbi:rhomboid-like protein 15 isoform X2 [Arachis stenosperma]|uniref:rhomboid-like protein 15 isoform X2 n=1 Tax=Arachis stenosperma TaxID=217475 RepID=UPI0025AB7C09|nr:rhomboid-like protein 15 isoform X2 [Arachis stenosperma]